MLVRGMRIAYASLGLLIGCIVVGPVAAADHFRDLFSDTNVAGDIWCGQTGTIPETMCRFGNEWVGYGEFLDCAWHSWHPLDDCSV